MRLKRMLGAAVIAGGLVAVPATSAYASNGYVHIQIRNAGGTVLGGVIFNGDGEKAEVCDDNSDGNYVHGYITWNGTTHELTDTNGSASGCAHANYSIAENTTVDVFLCVDNVGCSPIVETTA